MNRTRALSALAAIVHEIRTDWDEAGVLAVLQRNPDADLADLAHAAIRDWITSVTGDWRLRAELRRDALDLRAAITRKETA